MSRLRGASLPAEGLSQQQIRDCSRSAHELCGLGLDEEDEIQAEFKKDTPKGGD
jgi:hypothetical protein